jgi:hypothetical protein
VPADVSLPGTGESLYSVHDPEGGGLRAGPLGVPGLDFGRCKHSLLGRVDWQTADHSPEGW